jgi:hypothetical protein
VNLGGKLLKALAIALMLWCAGAGCMMVSYAKGAMSDMDSQAPAEAHAMHMSGSMDAHECCKAKRKGAKRSALGESPSEFTQVTIPEPVQSNAMNCCPLTSGSIVVASRSTSNDETPALSQTDSSAFKPSISYQRPLAIPLRLPNRAKSYLLDCAFLI